MTDDLFVVRDDVSWKGLRRRHVLRPGRAVGREEALDGQAVEFERAEAAGLAAELGWVDEAGMHHYYAAWKLDLSPSLLPCREGEKEEEGGDG